MRHLKSIAIALLLGSLMPAAALDIRQVEEANLANDLPSLIALRETAASDPYVGAYLEFCIGVAANVAGERKLAKTALKSSAALLRDEIERNPEAIEALALLANAYGMQIGMAPMKGPFLGPKADRAIRAALDLDTGNPRALMIQGISRYNTPAMFGGSVEGALGWFDKAIAAFGRGDSGPAWGHAEAYVWRGLTQQKLGDPEAARADFARAVELEPSYAWARMLLDTATTDAANRR